MTTPRAAPIAPATGGFTLAELIVVLALVAVLATLAAGSLSGLLGESGMRQPALELVSMATDAKQRADREGRPWELRFSRQAVTLASLAAGEGNSGAAGRTLVWDGSWTVQLRTWGGEGWRVLDEDEVLVWRAQPGALVAPLAFRLSDPAGRFVEIELDPLTAGIAREEWAL